MTVEAVQAYKKRQNISCNAPINSKLQHPSPRKSLGIWTFEDWIVQSAAPRAELVFKCATL